MARSGPLVAGVISAAAVLAVSCCAAGALVVAWPNKQTKHPARPGDQTSKVVVERAGDGSIQPTTTKPPPGLGQPVRDGKFEFVVTSIECGITRVGDAYLYRDAQGQFCLVRLTVTNIGDWPQMFTAANQHAYNAAGQWYDADSVAGLYLDVNSRAFLEDINPGNSVEATLVFDIPPDGAITKLELHDSMFSFGVTVVVAGDGSTISAGPR